MKRIIAAMLMVAICAALGFAQEEPIPPPRSRAARFGFFGGVTPSWLNVNVNSINDFLSSGNAAKLSTGGVFMFGGAGAAYILVIPNVRVGGVGMSGSIKSTSVDAQNYRRDAQLNVGFGGATFEYVVPLSERFDIAVGSMIGWGGLDLTLRQSNGGTNTWSSEQAYLKSGMGGDVNNVTRTLSGSFLVLVPSLNLEYAVIGWLGVRVGASYVAMVAPSWKVDNNYDLVGVPSSVSGKGFMVNAGVFFGTF